MHKNDFTMEPDSSHKFYSSSELDLSRLTSSFRCFQRVGGKRLMLGIRSVALNSTSLCNKQNSFHNLVPLQNLDVDQLKKNFKGQLPTALS